MLISGIALLGWWIDHAALAAWLPAIADMTFNTALCFMFVATACLMSGSRSVGIGIGIGIFALLSLLQDFFGLRFGIDNLLFNSHGYGLTSPHLGRMSPNTAAGFLLSAIVLVSMSIFKSKNRFTTMTHTLIILLGLLAFIGVSMTVLISDVPEGFSHFASMSLLTAIAFLLVSISLLSIYAQKYQYAGVNVFLHSAIHLMYRLKYPQKFVLISLVMLIPLAFLMSGKLTQLNQDVSKAKIKVMGIEHILATSKLLKVVPEHRGMLNAKLASSEIFSETMQQKTAEVDALFAVNNLMNKRHAENIDVPDEWPAIKERWEKIKANRHDSKLSWRLHTEIIALLGKHLRDVGNITLLSYDEDPMIHNIVAAELEILPQLFEQIGQLRGQGAGFIARRSISVDEQLLLGSMASEISLLLHESEQLLTYALKDIKHPELERLNTDFSSATNTFLAVAETQLISGKLRSISPEQYFTVATRALKAGYDFNNSALTFLKQIVVQQINESVSLQYTIKLSAVLIILLILYLFWGFYQSVMNTINALDDAVQRVRDGDSDVISALPTKDEMGHVVASFNAISNELMRVSSHMSAVVDHTVDGIITIDEHGVIKSFNPAAETIFGYLAGEVIGQNITKLMPEKYHERHQVGLQRYSQVGEELVVGASKIISQHGLMKGGAEFPMELSISSMVMEGQQFFVGMVRDISEQQEMEKQLLHAQKMEAVGALVGGVAHNFNNLLAGIVGKAYLAKRNITDKPQKAMKHLESIETISQQAGDMVKQLLTFAHKDFFLEEKDTLLATLIKEGYKTAKLGIAEDVTLHLNITAPNIMVHCDANQIQQVLMNMMNNARDAVADCSEKRISVSLSAMTPTAEFFHKHAELSIGEYACLTISDTGHGMGNETAQKIFDPFYTTKEVGLGTGLGLSSSFGSIAAHAGVIDVESEVDVGTTFSVYLPLIKSGESISDNNEHQTIIPSSHHETILLVDDDELVIEFMHEVLEGLEYKVFAARNGGEGLEFYKKKADEIAVIITDVVMPVMGGVDMFREIRKINSTVPVVFITGYDEGNVILNDSENENSIVLSKPVHIEELSRVIQEMM